MDRYKSRGMRVSFVVSMGKWSTESKTESKTSRLVFALLGVLGIGVLFMAFALNVSSAPSGYNNPVRLGHNPADIEGGTFYQDASSPADPVKNAWRFPGVIGVMNTSPVNAIALTISQAASGSGMYAIYAQAVAAQVLRLESSSTGGTQIGLFNSTDNQEWRIGTGITDDKEFVVRDETLGQDRLTIESTGEIGIGKKDPVVAVDVIGDVCSSLNGGKCLSNQGKNQSIVATTGLQKICTPSPCGSGPLNLATGFVDATCPAGFLPVSCGGGAHSVAAGSVRNMVITPMMTSLGDSFNGCRLNWDFSGAAAGTTGGAIAICAPIGA